MWDILLMGATFIAGLVVGAIVALLMICCCMASTRPIYRPYKGKL